MYPKSAYIPLQGLDRRAMTVGAMSGFHNQTGALLWHHFTICRFTWSTQSTLKKADQSTLANRDSEHA